MAKILIAASQEPQAICKRILREHSLVCTGTLAEAQRELESNGFDLILCTIAFDESRMFDLLRYAKSKRNWKRIPFVCAKVRPKVLDYPSALEGVKIACDALDAAAFLDIDSYSGGNPELGIRKDIERLLP